MKVRITMELEVDETGGVMSSQPDNWMDDLSEHFSSVIFDDDDMELLEIESEYV
jgi:hypothetical protein